MVTAEQKTIRMHIYFDYITEMQSNSAVRRGKNVRKNTILAFWKSLQRRRLQVCMICFDNIPEMHSLRAVQEGRKMLVITQLWHLGSQCRGKRYKHEYSILITLQKCKAL